jgi:hexosaminidase
VNPSLKFGWRGSLQGLGRFTPWFCFLGSWMLLLTVSGWFRATADVIPLPAVRIEKSGEFVVQPTTVILTDAATEAVGRLLAVQLKQTTGMTLKVLSVREGRSADHGIELRLGGDEQRLGVEGYTLKIDRDHVVIQGPKAAGVYYGCQTLRQLLPAAIPNDRRWVVSSVDVEDRPQFEWRGLLLDPARHFISKEGILKCIDWMGYYKLNRLHLHLTDIDGWRLEIPKYPRLTRIGAWANLGEGIKVGGYYTRKDIQEIVAYAAERFVVIVPEIETPSHSGAALVAYPELNCFGTRKGTELFSIDPLCGSEYCPGNDRVFEFLDDVFAEVIRLFPGPYIHVGGDEAEMRYWHECPKCQARQKQVGNLHAWFMERVKGMVESRGRRVVGWGGVAKGAIFTGWDNDGVSGWNAAKQGWDVIQATGNHHYINYNIDRLTLKSAYDFDPAPASAGLSPEARRHVLGVEATLWGEMVPENHIESQTFPRILAIAERAWGVEKPDFDAFLERVKDHAVRLSAMSILTGPAFGYPITPVLPSRIRNALPSMIYSQCQNQNDEDWRWTLTGIDKGQGYDALYPYQAFDGDLETFHLSWGPRKDVDTFTVALAKPERFDRVTAITGMANGDHRLFEGVLEVSEGYGRWKVVAPFKKGVARAVLDSKPVVAIRLRSTINQPPFALLAVREIVLEKEGKTTLREWTPVERLHLPVGVSAGGK